MNKLVNGVLVPLTQEEIEQREIETATYKAEELATGYIQKRQAEYPPMTDYLDGIVKGDTEQINKYIAECKAVKAKYPKGAI